VLGGLKVIFAPKWLTPLLKFLEKMPLKNFFFTKSSDFAKARKMTRNFKQFSSQFASSKK
jgi:hypothetical protein